MLESHSSSPVMQRVGSAGQESPLTLLPELNRAVLWIGEPPRNGLIVACRPFEAAVELLNGVACIVLSEAHLGDCVFRRLAAIRSRRAAIPIVLHTEFNPENARCLALISVNAVAWTSDSAAMLLSILQRTLVGTYLVQFSQRIQRNFALDSIVARALVRSCDSIVPLQTVNSLVRVSETDRSTFWRHWRRVFPKGEVEPKQYLDLVAAIRIAELCVTRGHDAAGAAAGAPTEPQRVLRMLQRVSGMPANVPKEDLYRALTSAFEHKMRPALTP